MFAGSSKNYQLKQDSLAIGRVEFPMETKSAITLAIAIWGALTGTLTLIWNYLKWRKEQPRIVASFQVLESRWINNSFAGLHIILRNRGKTKTTIEAICLYCKPEWREFGFASVFMRYKKMNAWEHNVGISATSASKLPISLDVNEKWEQFILFEPNEPDNEEELRECDRNRSLANALKLGGVFYSIQCAHTDRKIVSAVRYADDWGGTSLRPPSWSVNK